MREIPCKYLLTFFYMFHLIDKFSVIIITHMTCLNCTGLFKKVRACMRFFRKRAKKGIGKFGQKCSKFENFLKKGNPMRVTIACIKQLEYALLYLKVLKNNAKK